MTKMMMKTGGGAPALRELVRAGLATPGEERRYFEEVVRPAWDARHFAEGEALDLTSHDLVGVRTTKKEEGMTEQPYEKFLAVQGAETAAGADTSEEDAAFEAFAAESGLNDLTGRTPGTREAADLSVPAGEKVETSGTAGMGEEDAVWRHFVDQSGTAWMFGEDAGAATTDLSEGARDEGLPREHAEAEQLHQALRAQHHADTYGKGSDASDESLWQEYAAALGLDR